jgi:hypothetical protein
VPAAVPCRVAGLFVQLHAYLLAFLLVLVYAGAVVALFLFIIMLLDMQGGQPWRPAASTCRRAVAAALLARASTSWPSGAGWPRPGDRPLGRLVAQALRLPALHDLPAAGPGDGLPAPDRDARRDRAQQAERERRIPNDADTSNAYVMLSAALFAIGFLGVLVRRNTLVIYMCLELMLVAATLALVAFSRFNGTRTATSSSSSS